MDLGERNSLLPHFIFILIIYIKLAYMQFPYKMSHSAFIMNCMILAYSFHLIYNAEFVIMYCTCSMGMVLCFYCSVCSLSLSHAEMGTVCMLAQPYALDYSIKYCIFLCSFFYCFHQFFVLIIQKLFFICYISNCILHFLCSTYRNTKARLSA